MKYSDDMSEITSSTCAGYSATEESEATTSDSSIARSGAWSRDRSSSSMARPYAVSEWKAGRGFLANV